MTTLADKNGSPPNTPSSNGAAGPEPGSPVTPSPLAGPALPVSPAQLTVLVVSIVSIFFVTSFYGKSLDSYRINQRATQARLENERLREQIELMQEKVAYYSTESYLELAAREKLNLVRPGDRPLLIVPAGAEVATVAGPPPGSDRVSPLAALGHAPDWLLLFFDVR